VTSERLYSHSEKETKHLGEAFAKQWLTHGLVVAIRGDLGAGKTQFTKGIATACGIDERDLTSPTFALANEYEGHVPSNPDIPMRLFHLDCYRFEKPEELLELGVEDYLYPKLGATIIEWAERIEHFLPRPRMEVFISSTSETDREIVITHMSTGE